MHGTGAIEDGYFAHPFLASAGAIFAHWRGWESFHAGAVERDGRAVMILGDKGAGKTTTMAWLATRGWSVLADDLIVVDGEQRALAGPRCVDLRPGALEVLGVKSPMPAVRDGERHRLPLGDVALQSPLAGSLVLEAGVFAVERPGPSERMRRLHAARAISLPAVDMQALLDLAALPMAVLRRPLQASSLAGIERTLLELLAT